MQRVELGTDQTFVPTAGPGIKIARHCKKPQTSFFKCELHKNTNSVRHAWTTALNHKPQETNCQKPYSTLLYYCLLNLVFLYLLKPLQVVRTRRWTEGQVDGWEKLAISSCCCDWQQTGLAIELVFNVLMRINVSSFHVFAILLECCFVWMGEISNNFTRLDAAALGKRTQALWNEEEFGETVSIRATRANIVWIKRLPVTMRNHANGSGSDHAQKDRREIKRFACLRFGWWNTATGRWMNVLQVYIQPSR